MIVKNPELHDWSFLWKAFTREEFWYSDATFLPHFRNYRPLLLVWYWIDNRLFGLNPAPWHASVIVVHLLAVWLVFKISRRLTGDSTAALLAASVFALTPVHVAAVVWMAGSGFVLATTFGLAAFYLILPRAQGSVRNWAAAIALYACALLSHESASAFPALVACYAFLFCGDEPGAGDAVEQNAVSLWTRARRAAFWTTPFALEFLLYLVMRRLVLGFFVSNPYDYANLLTNTQAILTVPLVLATYLTILAMPWMTLPNHQVLPVSSALSPEFWVPLTCIGILVAAFLVLALRAPKRRLYLFCAAWVGVTLAPMMLLHSVYHLVQDYYLYLPSVGWSLLVGDLIVVIARKNAVARRLAFGGAAAMLLIYAAALWRVQRFWHDDIAAARGYIEGCPESTAWRLTLAIDLEHEGDLAQAENEVRAALRLEPDKTGTIHPSSKTLEQVLGMLLAEQGDIAGAELELRKSAAEPEEDNVRISAARLAYVEDTFALYGQGLANQASGRVDQAIKDISEAIERMTSVPSPRFLPLALRYVPLVELYDAKGNSEQVQSLLNKLESMPVGDMASGLARAMIRLQHSDKEGAERILRDLAERYPNDPEVLIRLGDLQADLNQHEEALNSYRKISDWVGHPRLYASTAKSLHALGREREALEQCRLALALAPTRDRQTQFVCLQIQQAIQNK